MALLETIEDFCEADPMVFLIAAVVLAVLIGALLLAIFWPLDRIHIEDSMQSPFGDAPHLDRSSR